MNFLSSAKITGAALVVSLIGCTSIATQVPDTRIAQASDISSRIQFSPPNPPDSGSPSDRGQGGGKRGSCDEKYEGLTALVPAPRPSLPDDRWGLTVSDRPTIWFSVPTGIDAGTLIEWKLRDPKGKVIYKTNSRLPKTTPGVIRFSVPTSLSIATYQWDLAIYCNSTNNTASNESETDFDRPLVRKGRVQRIAPPLALQQELTAAKTPLDRAKIYAKYSIWYDALTTLGTQMQSSQNNDKAVLEAWGELLKQQKLEGKASAIVTSCCTL